MTVDYRALRDLDLTELSDRVTAWTSVATNMTDAGRLYGTDVHTAMTDDDWTGEAAELAVGRSGELDELIAAGAAEAATLRDILTDAVDRFGAAKADLTEVVGEVDAIPELRVTGGGTVEVHPDAADGPGAEVWSHHISAFQERIDAAVDTADSLDTEVAEALSLAAETDNGADNTFNAQALDLTEAAQARADADRIVEVLRAGDDLTLWQEEIEEINELMDGNTDNPVFAHRLLSQLGPLELLHHAEMIAADTEGDNAELDERALANFGLTLATGTDTDNQPSLDTEWVGEFMAESATSGYLTAAPLLEHGEYHADFIVPVAEHMIRLEQVRDDIGVPYPSSYDTSPLSTALAAIERDPDAATALLTGSGAYHDMPYVDGGGDELEPAEDNVAALLEVGADGVYPELMDDEVLGRVIEAGATGLSADVPDGLRTEHTPQMAEVANSVVDYVAANPGEFHPDGDLAAVTPRLGFVAADYMEDIQRTLTNDGPGSPIPPPITVDAAGNPVNAFADRDDAGLNQFLAAISRTPEAYGPVAGASLAVMERSLEPALGAAADHPELINFDHAAAGHGMVTGLMDQGWTEIINDEYLAAAENRNGFLDLVGKGITAGGFIPHPAAGPVSTGLNELIVNPAMDDNLAEAAAQAEGEVEEVNEDNRRTHADQVTTTVEHLLVQLGYDETVAAAAAEGVRDEYFQTYGSARELVEND